MENGNEVVLSGRSVVRYATFALLIACCWIARAAHASLIVSPDGDKSEGNPEGRIGHFIEGVFYEERVRSRCMASTLIDDPKVMEPTFYLVPVEAPDVPVKASAPKEEVSRAGFEPSKQTIIVVHGWTSKYPQRDFMGKIADLHRQNFAHNPAPYNLIMMDYRQLAGGDYKRAAALVGLSGAFLASFVEKLIELGASRESITLIGHSMGVHTTSFAGKRLKPRIGRIVALDPAGPCFGKFSSSGPGDRLSRGDALIVDVYHTDDDWLGIRDRLGSSDIYINGGSKQPGCKGTVGSILSNLSGTKHRTMSEAHARARYMSAIQMDSPTCQLLSYECRDYDAFLQGRCADCGQDDRACRPVNHFAWQSSTGHIEPPPSPEDAKQPARQLFLVTSAEAPYCLAHYQAQLKDIDPKQRDLMKNIDLRLELFAPESDSKQAAASCKLRRYGPDAGCLITLDPSKGGHFTQGRVIATKSFGSLSISNSDFNLVSALSTGIQLSYMSNMDAEVRKSLSSRLCPAGGAPTQGRLDLVECALQS